MRYGGDLDGPTNLVPKHRCRCCLRFLPAPSQYQPKLSCSRPKLPCSRSRNLKCCDEYAAYLRCYGFDVDVRITNELAQISSQAGIPEKFQGCHTMFVDGYVVEGLVPGHVVRKLLSERPAIAASLFPECRPVRLECPVKSGTSSSSTRWR